MTMNIAEIEMRARTALSAIKAAHGTDEDKYGATLFVSHHLAEIDDSYWEERFQTASPTPTQILGALVFLVDFEDDYDMSSFNFTLPGNVTDHLLCVAFDKDGEVEDITMES